MLVLLNNDSHPAEMYAEFDIFVINILLSDYILTHWADIGLSDMGSNGPNSNSMSIQFKIICIALFKIQLLQNSFTGN